jgi:hypothetical protein
VPAGLVACDLFDLKALDTSTGVAWKVADRSTRDGCTISADSGTTLAIRLVPAQGAVDEALIGAQATCDRGTFSAQNVIDGGYSCRVGGVPSAGAIFNSGSTFVVVSAKTSAGVVESTLVDVLKSFVAPNSTPTYSSSN